MNTIKNISLERWGLAGIIGGFFSLFILVALSAWISSLLVCSVISLVALSVLTFLIAQRLPVSFDGVSKRHWVLAVIWLIFSVAALVRTGGVALYMVDAQQPQASAMWFDDFYNNHSCLSAYWKAGEVVDDTSNIYAAEHYAGHEGRFKIDEYLYPPQFLILPKIGAALGADFLQIRAIWFALDAALIAGIMLALCIWIGGDTGKKVALFLPAIWLSTPTLITLQTGNFQLLAIAMSAMAMVLYQRKQFIAGGALLGFALFKIFPGVLCAYLLFSRQWKALSWSVVWVGIYSVITLLIVGYKPFDDFIFYQLPKLASGELWAWLEIDGLQGVVAINHSVPGLMLKLKVAGFSSLGQSAVSAVAWIWSAFVVLAAFYAARKSATLTQLQQAQVWIVLLSLAALRSPFVPDDYALFPVLWLWCLVAATFWTSIPRACMLIATWLVISIVMQPFGGSLTLPQMLLVGTTSQLLAIALCVWVLYRLNVKEQSVASVQSKQAAYA